MTTPTASNQAPVAIIGMGGLFAKSKNLREYWRLLRKGVDAITDPPPTHPGLIEAFDSDPKRPDHIYCNRGGFLPVVAFDPTEFGIPPSTLEATDTSQLLGLVAAKMALSDAGYGDDRDFDRRRTSVILGVTGTQELAIGLGSRLGHPVWRRALERKGLHRRQKELIIEDISNGFVPWQENSFPGLLGNVVAGRISNRLDLGGTNCVVDAACASSLSALHLGLMELGSGRSNLVVTGGVDTINDIFMHMCFAKTGVLSTSGDARPFSADADGTVLGEGIGILVLKRLDEAERDGDRIYAVIRGIGSSSDGKAQSIYAPRADGQVRALSEAYRNAGLGPETVGLLEAHGTGTRVGDAVEFSALKTVFGSTAPEPNSCALGSVKSMIGHTKAAAGSAGVIKSALSLYHKVLPPTLKIDQPDPGLDLENSPFYLNTIARPWFSRNGAPRRSGVSAFGFGGSNFHVVLEEYHKQKVEIAWDGSVQILAFSQSSAQAVKAAVHNFCDQLDQDGDLSRIDQRARSLRACFSTAHPHRLVLVVDTTLGLGDLKSRLQSAMEVVAAGRSAPSTAQGIFYASPSAHAGKIAFLFPGQGSQYVHMGRDLACCFPEFQKTIEAAAGHFDFGAPLWDYLYPPPAFTDDQRRRQTDALRRTDVAQAAIGAVSAGMVGVLEHFRVRPDATCGHSYGELPALWAAGRIDRQSLWRLSAVRGRLMADAGKNGDAGSMLAVQAPITDLQRLAETIPDLVLANINSPDQGVLSGSTASIQAARRACAESGHRTIDLPVSAAFHSPLMASAQAPFARCVAQTDFKATPIPVFANVTAKPYPADPAGCHALLGRQLTASVAFSKSIAQLYADGVRTFIEVGPKTVLTGLVRAILPGKPVALIALDRSAGKTCAMMDLALAIGHLAALGADLDLNRWESAVPEPRPPKMTIPLCGANYRSRPVLEPTPLPDPPPAPAPASTAPADATQQPISSPGTRMSISQHNPQHGAQSAPSVDRSALSTPAADLNQALAILEKGLASIQALQLQTAQAHQKFLDAQTQAGRTLQEMINTTHRLMGSSAPMPGRAVADSAAPGMHRQPDIVAPSSQNVPLGLAQPEAQTPSAAAWPPPSEPAESAAAALPPPPPPTVDSNPKPCKGGDSLSQTLIAIVSQLTGYPIEMLGLEMEIEADLGIDSIKRVEILSALETRMPHLPRVTPEMMGTLKTLGQICDFLGGDAPPATPAAIDPPVPAPTPTADGDGIQQAVLAVVAELTGYPIEMLGLEMEIEADLGIDSIKRVEILSALETRMPHLPRVTPEMMGTLKTLGQIGAYLATPPATGRPDQPEAVAPVHAAQTQCPEIGQPTCQNPDLNARTIPRHVIEVVAAPKAPGRSLQIPSDRWVAVVGGEAALARSVADRLQAEHIAVRLITPAQALNPADFDGAGGLILCAPIEPETAFLAAKHAAPELAAAAKTGDALLAALMRMDGAFGFSGDPFDNPEQGALSGLIKTAALEWKTVLCRAIDLAPGFSDMDAAARQVVAELRLVCDRDPVEIGLRPHGRVALTARVAPASQGSLDLDANDVVVLTGGARGVTAACALCLAEASGAAIALIGRSAAPAPIPDWLGSIEDAAAIKHAIVKHELTGSAVTPPQLEAAYRKHMANRAIVRTIGALRRLGVRAEYFSADVTRLDDLKTVFDAVRSRMGAITALVHGAGVLHDRWIVDKTVAEFRQVYATKVAGLNHLVSAAQRDPLRHLVIFSSVSARNGNIGQSDYAMANEALNKMARVVARRHPTCRVTAINWGPWDGGMVTPPLRQKLIQNNIALIPFETGARLMVEEMKNSDAAGVEVIIGSQHLHPSEADTDLADSPMVLLERRELDLQRYPVLTSHVIGGQAVVPFALIGEWLGHGALKEHPGKALHGLDDFRLLSGIRLEAEKKCVRLLAGKAHPNGDGWRVDVELRNGIQNGRDVIHSRAKALLVDRFPAAPPYDNGDAGSGDRRPPLDVDAIYGPILFHGERLRAIKAIDQLWDRGMTAQLSGAPKPETWMQDPIQGRWIADPLVLDGAFQMAIVWCFEKTGHVCLPSYARTYRQYRSTFPATGVKAVMTVTAHNERRITADFIFLDVGDHVVATLAGYEATIDESLLRAFQNNGLSGTMINNSAIEAAR